MSGPSATFDSICEAVQNRFEGIEIAACEEFLPDLESVGSWWKRVWNALRGKPTHYIRWRDRQRWQCRMLLIHSAGQTNNAEVQQIVDLHRPPAFEVIAVPATAWHSPR